VGTASAAITVPEGYVYVIRDVSTRQVGGAGSSFWLRDAGGSGIFLLSVDTPSGTSGGHWVGDLVIPSLYTFTANAGGQGADYWISGYQLTVV